MGGRDYHSGNRRINFGVGSEGEREWGVFRSHDVLREGRRVPESWPAEHQVGGARIKDGDGRFALAIESEPEDFLAKVRGDRQFLVAGVGADGGLNPMTIDQLGVPEFA